MKGVVFTEFADMVEAQFGLTTADAVMAKSASDGVYTSVGDYDVFTFFAIRFDEGFLNINLLLADPVYLGHQKCR